MQTVIETNREKTLSDVEDGEIPPKKPTPERLKESLRYIYDGSCSFQNIFKKINEFRKLQICGILMHEKLMQLLNI